MCRLTALVGINKSKQVQADWNEKNPKSAAYIKNKDKIEKDIVICYPANEVFTGSIIINYSNSGNWLNREKFDEYISTNEGKNVFKNLIDNFYDENFTSGYCQLICYDVSDSIFNGGGVSFDFGPYINTENIEISDSITLQYNSVNAIESAYNTLNTKGNWVIGKVFATYSNNEYSIYCIVGSGKDDIVKLAPESSSGGGNVSELTHRVDEIDRTLLDKVDYSTYELHVTEFDNFRTDYDSHIEEFHDKANNITDLETRMSEAETNINAILAVLQNNGLMQ
jgi:hypothetical protein